MRGLEPAHAPMIFASAGRRTVFNDAPWILLFHYLLKYTTSFRTASLTPATQENARSARPGRSQITIYLPATAPSPCPERQQIAGAAVVIDGRVPAGHSSPKRLPAGRGHPPLRSPTCLSTPSGTHEDERP